MGMMYWLVWSLWLCDNPADLILIGMVHAG